MSKSGRVMNGWKSDSGAVPPNLNHIKTAKEKIRNFVNVLMKDTQIHDKDMINLFVANGIRFYSDFITILKDNPHREKIDLELMKNNENETIEEKQLREREVEKEIIHDLISNNIFLHKVSVAKKYLI